MRVRFLATVPAFLCLASTAFAADRPDVKGLYLLADYPAVSVQPGTTANIPIKLQNYGVPPERFQLSVSGVPAGWTATLLAETSGQAEGRYCAAGVARNVEIEF